MEALLTGDIRQKTSQERDGKGAIGPKKENLRVLKQDRMSKEMRGHLRSEDGPDIPCTSPQINKMNVIAGFSLEVL